MPSHRIRCVAAVLAGLVAVSGGVAAKAAGPLEETGKIIEKTRKAVLGTDIHRLSLYSSVQNYQLSGAAAMRSMLFTIKVSGDDALAYFCRNQPLFKEAVLRSVTAYHRTARGGGAMSEAELGRRARALFARYMEKGWLRGVEAHFIASAADAGPAVLETRSKCKAGA